MLMLKIFKIRRFVLSRVEIIHFRAIGNYGKIGFMAEGKSRRTRTAVIQEKKIGKDEDDVNDEDMVTKTQTMPVISERPKLNLKSLRNQNTKNVCNTAGVQIIASSKRFKSSQKELKMETHVEKKKEVEELKPNASPGKGKLRAVVDLQLMKAELKQLEDPPVTPWEKELSSSRLQYEFFDIPCEELAQRLLGKILVRYLENGTVLKGRIVETEGYLGAIDKASHSYQNKVTSRNLPMYMPPGTIYVYMTYGMYHCFNISSQDLYLTIDKVLGDGCAVLVRAVDPLEGVECMVDQRNTSKMRKGNLKHHELCNGPSKLCIAYQLNKQHSRYSLCMWKGLWIEDDGATGDIKIVKSARIGIDSCGPEWANKPLRYYIYGNKSVSKRNKKAEIEIS
ncbi:PREDICTED: DNA-3-methyladenine glycosylase-like isoform X3 [Wasmannia auropunctata]|uniref:DNA-3-methyladenine glycosylase-like isoform X3 n=1 Tax=Wasmannia auropunctata TaxID=64793 RepID=UPI0005EE87DD|nr:PREDICTED: DNA-3-methyladenine glycosylase-like isoform X3 [Wasmannia auropunctata]